MADFYEQRFLGQMAEATAVVKKVLGSARNPVLPQHAHHEYADKFALIEAQLGLAAACAVGALRAMGVSAAQLRALAAWAHAGSEVTLRLTARSACAFAREETREVEGPRTEVERTGFLASKTTAKVITKVTDYFWTYTAAWALDAYRGTGRGADDAVQLSSRASIRQEIKTATKSAPQRTGTREPVELAVTWLLRLLPV